MGGLSLRRILSEDLLQCRVNLPLKPRLRDIGNGGPRSLQCIGVGSNVVVSESLHHAENLKQKELVSLIFFDLQLSNDCWQDSFAAARQSV